MHSWCISGALLVHSWCTLHSWCTSGALLVHSWCTPGALSVHSWCTFGALQMFPERELLHFRKEAPILRTETSGSLFRHLQTRKGFAPLPKGSLDPMHKNVWILSTRKPERELPRFRKEASILRTETFGSNYVKARANDPPHENRLDRPRNYHILIERGVTTTRPQQNTLQTLPTERSMNGPGAHPVQRAAGTCRCASTATFILRTVPVALEATAQPGHPLRVRQLGEK